MRRRQGAVLDIISDHNEIGRGRTSYGLKRNATIKCDEAPLPTDRNSEQTYASQLLVPDQVAVVDHRSVRERNVITPELVPRI